MLNSTRTRMYIFCEWSSIWKILSYNILNSEQFLLCITCNIITDSTVFSVLKVFIFFINQNILLYQPTFTITT